LHSQIFNGLLKQKDMTKADIVNEISKNTGIEKLVVQKSVESFIEIIKKSLENGEGVYLRGFGSFIIKTRAQKTARNISKNVTITIPAHKIPYFKPAKVFVDSVKNNN
jgi:DNA-binding protein HU-beta